MSSKSPMKGSDFVQAAHDGGLHTVLMSCNGIYSSVDIGPQKHGQYAHDAAESAAQMTGRLLDQIIAEARKQGPVFEFEIGDRVMRITDFPMLPMVILNSSIFKTTTRTDVVYRCRAGGSGREYNCSEDQLRHLTEDERKAADAMADTTNPD